MTHPLDNDPAWATMRRVVEAREHSITVLEGMVKGRDAEISRLKERLFSAEDALGVFKRELVEARVAFEAEQSEKWKLAGALAEAERRLASITGLCGQEGCDGEPYDTFYRVATGEFDPCGSRRAEPGLPADLEDAAP